MSFSWSPAALLQSFGHIEIWNALLTFADTPLPLAAKGASASFVVGAAPESARVAALIQLDGLRTILIFESFPFVEFFEADLNAEDLERLPAALRDLLVKGMASRLWSLAARDMFPSYSIVEIGDWRADENEAPLDWLAVRVRGAAKSDIRLRLGLYAEDLTKLLADARLALQPVWTGLRETLTVAASVLAASMPIGLARLRSLRAGDVIVLAEGAERFRLIRVGDDLHRVRESEEGWIYAGLAAVDPTRPISSEEGRADVTDAGRGAAGEDAIGDLSLDVDFEIARMRIRIATLETWRSGAIVDLPAMNFDAPLEVTVRANGQTIAKGDLLRIDDRLAIRLTRLMAG